MKMRTLSTLDKLECLLYLINEQRDEKGNKVALPTIFKPTPDQRLFWSKVMNLCGVMPTGNVVCHQILEVTVRESKIIIEEKIFQDRIISFIGRPKALDWVNLWKNHRVFAKKLVECVPIIALIPRGDSPVFVS